MTDLTKLAEALEKVTPWEGFPGAVRGGAEVMEILDAVPERERPTRLGLILVGYRAAMEKMAPKLAELACWEEEFGEITMSFEEMMTAIKERDALQARVTTAEELLREIRDNEVNTSDEADKFLRDHQPSELSKSQARVAELEEQVTSLTNTTSGSYGNPQ